MNCKKCNECNTQEAFFCINCGEKLDSKVQNCPNIECRLLGISEDAIFCPDCGTKLKSNVTIEIDLENGFSNRNLPHLDIDFISGESCFNLQQYRDAFEYFLKSASKDNYLSINQLGNMYLFGLYVDKNVNKAIDCYIQAANLGNVDSQRSLGVLYSSGEFFEADFKEACKWLKMAAQQNDGLSQFALGLCHEYGNGTYLDLAEAKKLYKLAVENGNKNANERLEKAKFWYI